MDAITSILTVVFVAILLTVALTFGFVLMAFILSVALVTALLMALRGWWYRWRFVRGATQREENKVIEVEYRDISHTTDKEDV